MSRDTGMADRFARDTSDHQMTILHDDGLYRHIRFADPNHGFYWFDLVTWPGRLAISGDVDGFVFARLKDMFEFFRGNYVNLSYWAEKVTAGRDSVKTYSEELFVERVKAEFVEAVRGGEAPAGLGRAVREEILEDPEITYEDGARQALDLFEFKKFQFQDTWDWELKDYDWSFLWCCHAIQWGIGQYDAAKKTAVEPAAVAA